ncbi:MAG: aminotransferase class V-fold PLP-dependent enzyme [Pyrinomonadaceae bacterium]
MNNLIRSMFPVVRENVYLNSAAVAPMPTPTVAAVLRQLNDVSLNGTKNFSNWIETKESARELVAQLLGVRAEQIAFMRNTSDGISCAANGLTWKSSDNIVTFANEFPSNFYAWRRIRDKFGVELRTANEVDGRVDEDELCSLIDENTKVVSISAVQFSTGFRANLERIGEAAHKVGALFCVDFIQAFGALELNLTKLKIDIAAGASHKWLLAPEGCGIFYLSDRAQKVVEPTIVGWVSVEDSWNFEDYEQPFKQNGLAFESGTGNAALFYGLEQSLQILSDVGICEIEQHLETLTDYFCERLPRERYKLISSRASSEKSQIVSIRNLKGIDSATIFKSLETNNIIVSQRGENLRIAPHLFNTKADIDALIANLP